MKLLSLDLEMNQPSGTIIQVGVAVGDIYTGEVVDWMSTYIKCNEQLNPEIIQLTGVTQENVNNGVSLLDAYSEVKRMHDKYNCFRNALTWGGGDTQELWKQLGQPKDWCLGRRWLDTKTVFQAYCTANDIKAQSGLAKSMTKLGLRFQGRKHDAKDDAVNTFRIYRELVLRMKNRTK